MPLTCNLDQRGANIRRVVGIMALLAAAFLAALAFWSGTWWVWISAVAAAFLGCFTLFEARNKWCALRALKGSSSNNP